MFEYHTTISFIALHHHPGAAFADPRAGKEALFTRAMYQVKKTPPLRKKKNHQTLLLQKVATATGRRQQNCTLGLATPVKWVSQGTRAANPGVVGYSSTGYLRAVGAVGGLAEWGRRRGRGYGGWLAQRLGGAGGNLPLPGSFCCGWNRDFRWAEGGGGGDIVAAAAAAAGAADGATAILFS